MIQLASGVAPAEAERALEGISAAQQLMELEAVIQQRTDRAVEHALYVILVTDKHGERSATGYHSIMIDTRQSEEDVSFMKSVVDKVGEQTASRVQNAHICSVVTEQKYEPDKRISYEHCAWYTVNLHFRW